MIRRHRAPDSTYLLTGSGDAELGGFAFGEFGDGKSCDPCRPGILPAAVSIADPNGWQSASYAEKSCEESLAYSDFVPAAKLARREGLDVVLDPLWNHITPSLHEHIDRLRSVWPKPGHRAPAVPGEDQKLFRSKASIPGTAVTTARVEASEIRSTLDVASRY
jgi:hypothetical protein